MDDDLSAPLSVAYKTRGRAVSGLDYKRLKGTATILPGAASTSFTLRTLDNRMADGTTTLKLKLLPSAAGIYGLTKPSRVKILILDK